MTVVPTPDPAYFPLRRTVDTLIADWLAARGHADLTISSKWGYAYVGDWRTDADVHEIKEHTLTRYRSQLAESRALMEKEKGARDIWELKQTRGGLVDVEFLAQYLQLIHAAEHPHVLDQNTVDI